MAKDLSDRQAARRTLDWIQDLKQKDVDAIMRADLGKEDQSMKLIYEDAGIDTCIQLWRTLCNIQLYISEARLHRLRRLYVRKNFDVDNPQGSARELAIILGTSEKFVYDSLNEDAKEDPRQVKMAME